MTVEEMRLALGLGADVSAADVIEAYGALPTAGPIVTLAEAKLWLRFTEDETHEDGTIELLIAAATEHVLTIAEGYDPMTPAPAALKLAVLAHVARAFGGREDGSDAPAGNMRLVQSFRMLGV